MKRCTPFGTGVVPYGSVKIGNSNTINYKNTTDNQWIIVFNSVMMHMQICPL